MPKFLIDKLKAEYGQDSKIPYKVANARGYMKGPNETQKGRDLQAKHDSDQASPAIHAARMAAGGTVTPTSSSAFGGTWDMNPDQFATEDTANQEAGIVGGTVSNSQPTSGPITYSQPQYGVTAPGQSAPMNAGLVNGLASNSLYDPQQVSSFLDNSDGNYTSAANVPPVVAMTNGGGSNVNIGAGPVTPAMAAAMQAAGGSTPTAGPTGSAGTANVGANGPGGPGSVNWNQFSQRTPGTPGTSATSYPPFPPATGNGTTTGVGPNPVTSGSTPPPAGTPPPPGGTSTPPPTYAGGPTPTSYVPPMPNGGYPTVPGGFSGPFSSSLSQSLSNSGPQIGPELESDRQIALAGGQQLQNQFGSENAAAAARTAALQGQDESVYAPLLAGQGGYTADQAAGIMDETGPHGLNTLDPNAMTTAFNSGAAGVNGAVGNEGSAVDQSLRQGAANVNATINPADLTYTPEMAQEQKDAAARASAAKTQSAVQNIQNSAFAAGNDSPAAIAAMQDRARQTGAIDSSESQAAATLAAQQAALNAAQTRTNIESQNQQEIAQRDVGAKLNVGATDVGAKTALTSQGIGAAQAGQTEGMNLNNLESTRSNTIANENQKQSAEARQNLQSQEQQSNQTVATTGQQQLGTLGTQNTGVNQAAGEQIQNKAVNQSNPGNATHIIFGEKGIPPMDGPVVAEVGEKKDEHSPSGYAPEAIVNLGPPHHMAAGGAVKAPKLLAPPRFVMNRPAYGIPAAQPRQISRVGFNRQLPQFEYGGIVKAEDGVITGPPQGGDDPLTLDGPSGWQKAAALATQVALGRRLPAIAALLARKELGQDASGRDLGAAAVGDMLKRNPAAAAAAQEAMKGTNPAQQAQDAKWGQDYNDIMNFKPPTYTPNPMAIDSGGGQPSAPAPAATTKAPPKKFTPPPAKTAPPPTVLDAPPPVDTTQLPPVVKDPAQTPPPFDAHLHVDPPPPDKELTPAYNEKISFGGYPGSGSDLPPGTYNANENPRGGPSQWYDRTGNSSTDPNLSTDPFEGGSINPDNPVDPTGIGTDTGYESGGGYGGDLGIGSIGGDGSGWSYGGYGGSGALPPEYGNFFAPGFGGSGGSGYENGFGGFQPDPWAPDGFAKGGIVAPPSSPYGVEVVNHPQIRTLGANQPQAVVPLKKNSPGAKIRPGQIPALIQKYRQRPAYGA